MKITTIFLMIITILLFSCKLSNAKLEQEELYGVWYNVGKDDLKLDGIIFITPKYSAYLKKTKEGYRFTKSKYEIFDGKTSMHLPPMFTVRIERKFNGDIVLNKTNWIIPFILSYDGIIKREKMPKQKLYEYLDSIDFNIEEMKKTPIGNNTRTITKELINNTRESKGDLKELLIKESVIENYSIPKEIEEYLEYKSKKR